MEYKLLDGIEIPVLGLGTWGMGEVNDKQDIEAIQYAVSLGITHIDTAEMYGAGHTEKLVGQAIKKFKREEVFITSKVSPSHLEFDQVLSSCRKSLQRLNTQYLDLYLIHWPNPDIPLEETVAAMDELVNEGLIRFIGVSNFSVDLLQQAQKLSRNKIVCDQVEYSLQHKEPEANILPYCQNHNVVLTAYSPLDRGSIPVTENPFLTQLGEKYQKTPVQIALRYLIQQPNVIAIPKSSSKEHLDEITGALGWQLSEEDFQALKNL